MRPLRILVVDDNHLIRGLIGLILEAAGHVPVHAESGEIALELAHDDPPDLCFVDEAMPGMSGSELIRALRRARDVRLATVPVIGISGRAAAAQELLAAGANVFLPKPIEEEAVLSAIDRVLGVAHAGGSASGVPAS